MADDCTIIETPINPLANREMLECLLREGIFTLASESQVRCKEGVGFNAATIEMAPEPDITSQTAPADDKRHLLFIHNTGEWPLSVRVGDTEKDLLPGEAHTWKDAGGVFIETLGGPVKFDSLMVFDKPRS